MLIWLTNLKQTFNKSSNISNKPETNLLTSPTNLRFVRDVSYRFVRDVSQAKHCYANKPPVCQSGIKSETNLCVTFSKKMLARQIFDLLLGQIFDLLLRQIFDLFLLLRQIFDLFLLLRQIFDLLLVCQDLLSVVSRFCLVNKSWPDKNVVFVAWQTEGLLRFVLDLSVWFVSLTDVMGWLTSLKKMLPLLLLTQRSSLWFVSEAIFPNVWQSFC